MTKKKQDLEKDGLQENVKPTIQLTKLKEGQSRLRVQFDITYNGHPGVSPKGESLTEPDLTLRLGQLLERHSRGKDVPERVPLYFDTEIPTFNDLTDVDRYHEQLKRRLQETEEFLKAEKAKSDEPKAEAKVQPTKAPGEQLEITDDSAYKEKSKSS